MTSNEGNLNTYIILNAFSAPRAGAKSWHFGTRLKREKKGTRLKTSTEYGKNESLMIRLPEKKNLQSKWTIDQKWKPDEKVDQLLSSAWSWIGFIVLSWYILVMIMSWSGWSIFFVHVWSLFNHREYGHVLGKQSGCLRNHHLIILSNKDTHT
jgi:hypothetical protein